MKRITGEGEGEGEGECKGEGEGEGGGKSSYAVEGEDGGEGEGEGEDEAGGIGGEQEGQIPVRKMNKTRQYNTMRTPNECESEYNDDAERQR